jgi:hypothetical protein
MKMKLRMKMRTKAMLMGLSGMMFLLAACEKELPDVGSGETVEVFLSAGTSDYETSGEVRSFGAQELKPETVIVPLEDNLYLSATLIPDAADDLASDELRAALANNQRIRFAAYNGASQVGIATYSYSTGTGQFTPIGNPLGVEPTGTNYRFTAHSYYNSATTPAEANIAPSADLVWGYKDQAVNTTWNSRIVNINMAHKFSRVRVKIDAHEIANAITEIGTVQIVGGKTVNLTVRTGDVASTGTNAAQTVTFSGTSNVQTSGYYPFYPSPTSVTISSIKMTLKNSTTKTISLPLTAKFTKTLAAATSYTLVVDVREGRWAHSNIYWTGSALTFDQTDLGHEDYQGVFFRWGSLVGISPVGTNTTAPLYIPNVAGGTWDGTKTISSSGLPWTSNWNSIPYLTSMPGGKNYLYEANDFTNYKGDICNYIDNTWRMPNLIDFGSASSYDTSMNGTGPSSATDPTGKTLMGNAVFKYNSGFGPVFFPVSGFLYLDNGYTNIIEWMSTCGVYQMGSGGKLVYYPDYGGSEALDILGGGAVGTSNEAYTVRCIKKLPTE